MSKKILVVDDSKTIRQQVTFTLKKGGYEVVEAEDGQKGLEALSSNPDVALVVSDVNMPNKGGLEMLEEMKANGAHAALPVIMLTTEGDAKLLERAKAAGAKGWLVKPFEPQKLIAVVEKLVS